MAKSQKPLTPAQAKKELARFKKALNASGKKRARAFKSAALKAAKAEAAELAKKYEASSKAMDKYVERVFQAQLKKRLAPAGGAEKANFVAESGGTADAEIKVAVSELAQKKADALRALLKNRSSQMTALLEEHGLVRCGVGPKDRLPRAPDNRPPKCPSDQHKDPGQRNDGDEHTDNLDD
jgi:hypothetical protein